MDRKEAQQRARSQVEALAGYSITAHQAAEGLWIDVEQTDKLLAALASSKEIITINNDRFKVEEWDLRDPGLGPDGDWTWTLYATRVSSVPTSPASSLDGKD
jgi:hypothetical protein